MEDVKPTYEMCFDHDEEDEEFSELIVCPVCEIERLRSLEKQRIFANEELCKEIDRLRALLLHVANNAEFDECACKDWRGWIKHQMTAPPGE